MTLDEQFTSVVKRLPRRLRDAFIMRYVEGRPVTEIAAALHVSEGRVGRRLTKALRMCRERMAAAQPADH